MPQLGIPVDELAKLTMGGPRPEGEWSGDKIGPPDESGTSASDEAADFGKWAAGLLIAGGVAGVSHLNEHKVAKAIAAEIRSGSVLGRTLTRAPLIGTEKRKLRAELKRLNTEWDNRQKAGESKPRAAGKKGGKPGPRGRQAETFEDWWKVKKARAGYIDRMAAKGGVFSRISKIVKGAPGAIKAAPGAATAAAGKVNEILKTLPELKNKIGEVTKLSPGTTRGAKGPSTILQRAKTAAGKVKDVFITPGTPEPYGGTAAGQTKKAGETIRFGEALERFEGEGGPVRGVETPEGKPVTRADRKPLPGTSRNPTRVSSGGHGLNPPGQERRIVIPGETPRRPLVGIDPPTAAETRAHGGAQGREVIPPGGAPTQQSGSGIPGDAARDPARIQGKTRSRTQNRRFWPTRGGGGGAKTGLFLGGAIAGTQNMLEAAQRRESGEEGWLESAASGIRGLATDLPANFNPFTMVSDVAHMNIPFTDWPLIPGLNKLTGYNEARAKIARSYEDLTGHPSAESRGQAWASQQPGAATTVDLRFDPDGKRRARGHPDYIRQEQHDFALKNSHSMEEAMELRRQLFNFKGQDWFEQWGEAQREGRRNTPGLGGLTQAQLEGPPIQAEQGRGRYFLKPPPPGWQPTPQQQPVAPPPVVGPLPPSPALPPSLQPGEEGRSIRRGHGPFQPFDPNML